VVQEVTRESGAGGVYDQPLALCFKERHQYRQGHAIVWARCGSGWSPACRETGTGMGQRRTSCGRDCQWPYLYRTGL